MKEPIFEYFDIITNRLQNPLPKGEYGERHHIYPKSCGGTNDKFNIVKLTPEEHYRCHCLLMSIFEDEPANYRNMVFAWFIMHKRDGVEITEEEFGAMKRKLSEIGRGENNPFFGRHHSEETRKRLSDMNRGKKRAAFSEEHKRKIGDSRKGKKRAPFSEEWRKHLSESHKGRIPWNKGKKWSWKKEKKV